MTKLFAGALGERTGGAKWRHLVLAATGAMIFASEGSTAMTTDEPAHPACHVTGAAKYIERAGGSAAICRTMQEAVHRRHVEIERIDVQVRSASAMSATVQMRDGRKLPEHRFAVSDGELSTGAVARFADAVAEQAAIARKN